MEVVQVFICGACKEALQNVEPIKRHWITLERRASGETFDIHKPVPVSLMEFLEALELPAILIYPTEHIPGLSNTWKTLFIRFTLTSQGKRRYEYSMSGERNPFKESTNWTEQYERWKVQQLGNLITM